MAGYNLRKKQVNDMGHKNMERSNDAELIIDEDEETDMSPSAFIGLLKSQVKDLREELKLKNEIILNLSEAVKSLGHNESTSSTRKRADIPVSNDNAPNISCIPSDNMHDNINSVANVATQLRDVRQSYREKYYSTKSKAVDVGIANTDSTDHEASCTEKSDSPKESSYDETQTGKSAVHTWRKGTTLIVGDSMLGGVKEGLIGPRGNMKVRSFPGATLDDMIDYLRPLLRKKPDRVLLHAATNDAVNHGPDEIIKKILNVKAFIENEVKDCNVIISSPINRLDNQKCATIIRNVNAKLKNVGDINLMSNDNITTKHLGMKKLHMNMSGTKLLVNNILAKLRSI